MKAYLMVAALMAVLGVAVSDQDVSYSSKGKLCMTPCVKMGRTTRCYLGFSGRSEICTKGPKTTATAQTNGNVACTSHCGYFGKSYKWCFTSANRETWDYCKTASKKFNVAAIKKQLLFEIDREIDARADQKLIRYKQAQIANKIREDMERKLEKSIEGKMMNEVDLEVESALEKQREDAVEEKVENDLEKEVLKAVSNKKKQGPRN